MDTILDLDAMLDTTLDDIENLPDYVTPPTGVYMLAIADCDAETFDKKVKDEQGNETGDKVKAARIRLTYRIEDVLEYAEHSAVPVSTGSLFSDSFMLDEKGKAFFKRQAAKVLKETPEALDGISLRDLFTALKEVGTFKAGVKTVVRKGQTAGSEYENTFVTPIHG